MSQSSRPTRRTFLARAAAAAAAGVAAPYLIPSGILAADGSPGPNERIGVAGIGVGRQGSGVYGGAAGSKLCRPVAVADANIKRAEQLAARYKIDAYRDYRKLLERKDVDAVTTATPDHWRALVCIHACQAGKDVYAEKPLTLAIAEGTVLVQVVRKHRRVFQVGSQQRSMAMNRMACEFVRKGGLGKIALVRGMNYPGPQRSAALPEKPPPAGLDWDAWLGQAAMRPYHPDWHQGWMRWRDFSGGEMTNWGAHGLDQIQWALGMDGGGPKELWPLADGPKGAIGYRYPNGIEVHLDLERGPMGGAIFAGEKGKIEINRNKFTTNPPELIADLPPKEEIDKWRDEVALWQAKYHLENWLDCMRTRQRPVADVEIGHRSISISHLANIARELGRKLQWDPAREQFVGDDEANQFVARPRREGYELPQAT